MYDYYTQLVDECEAKGINLMDAVKSAGIPSSTYWRWLANKTSPSEITVRQLFKTIHRLHRENTLERISQDTPPDTLPDADRSVSD
jgi:predicted transcriptional regulator